MADRLTRRDVLKRGSVVAGLSAVAGCTGGLLGDDESIAVGSKQFTEQELLGYLAYEALDATTDLSVSDEVGLGGTNTNFKALQEGQIDLYWEYTGTAWATLPPQHDEVISDPEEIYERVNEEFQDEHGLEFLDRAPFNNTYVLMGNPDWVAETGLESISDFADYVTSGNTDVNVVMNAEFQERADGWPGLAEHYGFDDVDLSIQNVGSGLTYQILGEGEADVGMGFNTNPKIIKFDLEILDDDEEFFPVYNPAPLVKQETLNENEAMAEPLNEIGPALSTDTIRGLNQRVSIDGESAQAVAQEFLENENII
jgi:osmoprotectant transport system substrate-binding protein